jgi:hypothetical protein
MNRDISRRSKNKAMHNGIAFALCEPQSMRHTVVLTSNETEAAAVNLTDLSGSKVNPSICVSEVVAAGRGRHVQAQLISSEIS